MAASDDLKAAEQALQSRVQSYSFGGKTYTLTELRDTLLPQLRKQADAEKKAARAAAEKARTEKAAASTKAAATAEAQRLALVNARTVDVQAKQALDRATKNFANGKIDERALRAAEQAAATAAANRARLEAPATTATTTAAAGGAAPPGVRPQPAVTPTVPRVLTRAERGEVAAPTAPQPPAATPTGTTAKGKKKKKQPEVPPSDDSFLDELAASFPAYADWSSANAIAYFGNDLIDVFRKINDGIYDTTTAEGRAGIQRAIEQTSYWRTTQASIKNWDQLAQPDRDKRVADQKALIASTFGDLGLDDATLTDLATIAQRTGLNDLGLRQQVYGRALAKPAGVGLDTRTLALESAAADNLRAVGRAYGYTPSTAELESALTGKPMAGTGTVVTEETIRQKAQKAAKGQYSWLSEQIDAGLTLDDIFTNYRNYAARTLQVDPSTIDFTTNPKWAVAFGDKQNGQLSLNEWTRRLKSDPQYGWQFTDEANKQVNSVVSTLERAFGLVK